MAVSTRLEPINKDISLLLAEMRDPTQRSALFADLARDQIEEAKKTNAALLGRVPPFHIFVDGQRDAPIESVKPNGVIVIEFQLVQDVLRFIGAQLVTHSPVVSGHYVGAHVLLADGVQVDPQSLQQTVAAEYVFINTVPYARKIERGMSPQAPHGVYQAVATLAKRQFGRFAKIEFNFRSLSNGQRQPAIIVKTR